MTSAEKLEALVRRNIENGWNQGWHQDKRTKWPPDNLKVEESYGDQGETGWYVWIGHSLHKLCDSCGCEDLIFNHDFARALFGEELIEYQYCYNGTDGNVYPEYLFSRDGETPYTVPAFEYHLQQAVIADDPISYFYDAIFGGSDGR